MQETMPVESMSKMGMTQRRISWRKILGYSLLGLVFAGIVLYATVLKSYILVGKSMASLTQYDSAQVVYQTEDQKVKVVADLSGEGKPTKVEMSVLDLGEQRQRNLVIGAIFDDQNLYIQGNYSEPKFIDQVLMIMYPPINKTQTYKMAAPLWKGEKWLHVAFPETKDEPEVDFEWDSADVETKKFVRDLLLAIKPGKIEKNYGFEGESYTKVSYGFRKERLIKAINDLKDLEVDLKVSQINSLVEIVESSDEWDRDLLTFLIDKRGDLRVVLMQLPKIDEKVLNEGIIEGASEDKTGMAVGLAGVFKNMVWQEEGELVSLGSLHLGQFDQVQAPEIPTDLVEGVTLWESATRELGPIVGQMLIKQD